jgi:hypothetical protein
MQNKIIGIYLITEKATGKMYVGLSGGRDGIEGRWFKHRKRFPEALFSYEIFHPCPSGTTRAELSLLEKFYIRELDCMEPNGFNRTSGGTGSTEVSEATKKRQSEAGKNRAPASAEARANMSAFQKGRVKSAEHVAKVAAAQRGKTVSKETRAKQSEAAKAYYDSATPEEKQKRSEAVKASLANEETKKRQSEAGKNRAPASAEARANMSAFQKGRVKGPMSEEQKLKLSQAAKERAVLKRAARAEALAVLEASLLQDPQTISTPE